MYVWIEMIIGRIKIYSCNIKEGVGVGVGVIIIKVGEFVVEVI